MQIVPFLTHYQLVYANFDFSSFSLISYVLKVPLLHGKRATLGSSFGLFYNVVPAGLQPISR